MHLPALEVAAGTVHAGWVGGVVVVILIGVTYLLWRNMGRQLNKIDFDELVTPPARPTRNGPRKRSADDELLEGLDLTRGKMPKRKVDPSYDSYGGTSLRSAELSRGDTPLRSAELSRGDTPLRDDQPSD